MKNKLSIILLAAGSSRRFSGNKLLTLFKGKPMYLYGLEAACTAAAELKKEWNENGKTSTVGIINCNIIIVTSHEEIRKYAENRGITVIENDEPEAGISKSIKLALVGSGEAAENYMFCVCDQPLLKKDTIKKLANEYLESGKTIGCLVSKGVRGNPCIFHEQYNDELKSLKGDKGGKVIMEMHPDCIVEIECINKIEMMDVDTPKDKQCLMTAKKR